MMYSMKMYGGGLIMMMLVLMNTVQGLSLRSQFVMAMEQQAMSEASMELMMIATAELEDSCPSDNCELCNKIDVSFAYSQNNYPCDDSGNDCCGSQCKDLGVTLSYLEAYVKYLKPLVNKLLEEQNTFMAKVKELQASMNKSSTTDPACIQAQIKLRSKALSKLRAKIGSLQIEKAGALYNLQRVFTQCVDETWCENDNTQAKILPDESLWKWLDDNKCAIISYLVDVVTALIDIGIKFLVPPIAALASNPICDVPMDIQTLLIGGWNKFTAAKAIETLTESPTEIYKVKEELFYWVLGTLVGGLCKLKDDVPEFLGDAFNALCWINDSIGSTADALGGNVSQQLSVYSELLQTVQSCICGDFVSALATIAKVPIMCQYDTCAVEIADDCKNSAILYFFGWKPAATLAPTQAPTRATQYGSNVITVNPAKDIAFPAGYTINSLKNGYQFEIMATGNAVLHHTGGVDVWDTFTKSTQNPQWVFQTDGNLVQYVTKDNKRSAVWATGTSGNGKFFAVSDYGFAMMLTAQLEVKWSSFGLASPTNSIHKTQIYEAGYSMKSLNGKYELFFQGDGNLVVYDLSAGRTAIYSTGTTSYDGYRAYFSFDSSAGKFYIRCRDCSITDYAFSSSNSCDSDLAPFVLTLTDGGEIQVLPQRNSNKICFNSKYD